MKLYAEGRDALYSPGTPDDLRELRACAIDCWVFVLRRRGQRLPPNRIEEPTHGSLLAIDRWGDPERPYVRLYVPAGKWDRWADELHLVAPERVSADGVRVLTGQQFDQQADQHFRQTWLCAPTVERGYEILRRMAGA